MSDATQIRGDVAEAIKLGGEANIDVLAQWFQSFAGVNFIAMEH